jgi:hypothetical protein
MAQQILQTSEDVLVFTKTVPKDGVWRILSWLIDPLQSLLLFNHGGFRMWRSIILSVFYICLMAFVIFVILKPLGIVNPERALGHFYAWCGLLAVTILFSKPSRYALTGFSANEVDRVFVQMPILTGCSKVTFQAIKSHLQRAEGDTKARLTTIKWAAGIPYAIFIYLAQKGWDLQDGKMIGDSLMPLLAALFIGAFISLHARATEVVYGLSFSVVDQLEALSEKRINSQSAYKSRMLKRGHIKN